MTTMMTTTEMMTMTMMMTTTGMMTATTMMTTAAFWLALPEGFPLRPPGMPPKVRYADAMESKRKRDPK